MDSLKSCIREHIQQYVTDTDNRGGRGPSGPLKRRVSLDGFLHLSEDRVDLAGAGDGDELPGLLVVGDEGEGLVAHQNGVSRAPGYIEAAVAVQGKRGFRVQGLYLRERYTDGYGRFYGGNVAATTGLVAGVFTAAGFVSRVLAGIFTAAGSDGRGGRGFLRGRNFGTSGRHKQDGDQQAKDSFHGR